MTATLAHIVVDCSRPDASGVRPTVPGRLGAIDERARSTIVDDRLDDAGPPRARRTTSSRVVTGTATTTRLCVTSIRAATSSRRPTRSTTSRRRARADDGARRSSPTSTPTAIRARAWSTSTADRWGFATRTASQCRRRRDRALHVQVDARRWATCAADSPRRVDRAQRSSVTRRCGRACSTVAGDALVLHRRRVLRTSRHATVTSARVLSVDAPARERARRRWRHRRDGNVRRRARRRGRGRSRHPVPRAERSSGGMLFELGASTPRARSARSAIGDFDGNGIDRYRVHRAGRQPPAPDDRVRNRRSAAGASRSGRFPA